MLINQLYSRLMLHPFYPLRRSPCLGAVACFGARALNDSGTGKYGYSRGAPLGNRQAGQECEVPALAEKVGSGLPGNEISFKLCPFIQPISPWADVPRVPPLVGLVEGGDYGARSGQRS